MYYVIMKFCVFIYANVSQFLLKILGRCEFQRGIAGASKGSGGVQVCPSDGSGGWR